ncbi:hypothetical protein BBP40_008185 [Aspergillus hancockii]|nr:hypothetical protein BBP40_008185 [Aspergillus hancockii]
MFATFSSLERDSDGPSKPKRRQVSRACDACRLKRTKCDEATPCSTCVSRNWVCSRTRSDSHPTSLASALIQLATLEERIRVLESQPPRLGTPRGPIEDLAQWKSVADTRRSWWSSHDDMGDGSAYFGPLSTAGFIACVQRSWDSFPDRFPMQHLFAHQPLPTYCRQPRDLSETYPLPESTFRSGFLREIITKSRQWHYVHHFWHLHHPLLPILCEKDFTEAFQSLWVPDGTQPGMRRASSALVDIVIAICSLAQSSRPKARGRSSQSPRDAGSREWTHEMVSIWHYRRCKWLLDDELETPTLTTVQSHILMSLYLYIASRPSAAYNSLGTAGRIAYSLGLHRDPPATLGPTKQELRRRIWWSLYILDSRLSRELGRPTIITLHVCDCQLPADDVETAKIACLQPFSSTADVTWLTYTVQLAKLVTIVQSIYADVYGENSTTDSHATMSDDTLSATTTTTLEKHLRRLYTWADAVPHDLRLSRTGEEPALSYKFSGIQVDLYAPRWLQSQRVFLEALYHDAVVALLRPIALLKRPSGQPPDAMDHLLEQLHGHAQVVIRVCHQLYLETDVLSDHPELSAVVWSAAITLLHQFVTGPGEHDVARSLALVVEILEHVDGIDKDAIHALANVQKASFMGQWTPESLPPTEGFPGHQSPTLDISTLAVPHTITDGVYSSAEVGHSLPLQELDHPMPVMNSELWFNDTTWLGE